MELLDCKIYKCAAFTHLDVVEGYWPLNTPLTWCLTEPRTVPVKVTACDSHCSNQGHVGPFMKTVLLTAFCPKSVQVLIKH